MPKLIAKNPFDSKLWIKPSGLVMRASIVDTPYREPYAKLKRDYLTNQGSYINENGQLRSKYSLAFNGTAAEAQKRANEEGKPIGTRDPKMERFLPKNNSTNPYGTVKLPKQWKYKPEKNAIDLADQMLKKE